MSPSQAIDDAINGCLRNSKFVGKNSSPLSVAAPSTDFLYRFHVQFARRYLRSFPLPSFFDFVAHVVGMGAKKKMICVYAPSIVAMVQDR